MGRPKGVRKALTAEERERVEVAALAVEAAVRDLHGMILGVAVELARLARALDSVPALRPPDDVRLTPPGAAYLLRYEEIRRADQVRNPKDLTAR